VLVEAVRVLVVDVREIKWNVIADISLLLAEWKESRAGSLVPYLLYDA
jgi:hypothetical protein